jgi:hypothetical protein
MKSRPPFSQSNDSLGSPANAYAIAKPIGALLLGGVILWGFAPAGTAIRRSVLLADVQAVRRTGGLGPKA